MLALQTVDQAVQTVPSIKIPPHVKNLHSYCAVLHYDYIDQEDGLMTHEEILFPTFDHVPTHKELMDWLSGWLSCDYKLYSLHYIDYSQIHEFDDF